MSGIVVDWERAGKERRQANADTQINSHTVDDLRRVRRATDALVVCRINHPHPGSASEIDAAIDAGADELLVPMVRRTADVEVVLERVRGRCRVGILIETQAAVALAAQLCALDLSRVYLGLNDLAIDRGAQNIFSAVSDGTVERVRRSCGLPFGWGGLTLPDAGRPVPCRLLIAEMARLQTNFSFLRRSFHRDISGKNVQLEVAGLLNALERARTRDPKAVVEQRLELEAAIGRCAPGVHGWTSLQVAQA